MCSCPLSLPNGHVLCPASVSKHTAARQGLIAQKSTAASRALKGCHLVHDIILLITFFSSEQIGRHTDDQRHASDVQGDVKVVIALDACLGRGG